MKNTWDKLCRACLTAKESFTYFLAENVSTETYLFCTSIEVQEDEPFPKALCNSCYELVTRYAEFKQNCIESQNTLLLYSNSVKSEQTHETTQSDTQVEDILEIQNVFESEPENTLPLYSYSVKVEQLSQPDANLKDVLLLNVFENVKNKFEDINVFVKEESSSAHFNEDSEELSDKSIENIVFTLNRRKHKTGKSKEELESIKEKLHFFCELCHKKFKYQKSYETHKEGHYVERESLQCLTCNKTFVTTSGLKRHKESAHDGVRLASVACAHCGRVCASKHSLRAHEKTHLSTRAHGQDICHVCGKLVSSAVILKAHLETHRVDRERRHTCEHCGKKFFTNTILLSHIKRLHSGLRYICDLCDYPFTDKYNLYKHLLIHDGKKPYKCDICDKSYATRASLIEHKRIHSGERPFHCSFCSNSFLSKRRLMDHHRTHTGDKPHKCAICEQRFTQRGTLKRHMKVHEPMKAPPHTT